MTEKWDFTNRKSAPKKGRRAGLGFNFTLSPRDDEEVDEMGSPTNKTTVPPSAPPRSRKSGGWAGESLKSAKRSGSSTLLDQELLDRSRDSDDDIPVIPNLDDYVDDELASQIAKAPMMGINRMATYKELDADILKLPVFANMEVNLRVLTKYLYADSALHDTDIPWTRNKLFGEVVAGFNENSQTSTHTN